MKKFVAILFLIIYSCTTVSATMHMHYCMNRYIGASLYHTKEKKCTNCGMDKSKSNGCCKDEHKILKLKREHQKTTNSYDFSVLNNPVVITEFIIHDQYSFPLANSTYSSIHAPPDKQSQSIYLLNCVFLI